MTPSSRFPPFRYFMPTEIAFGAGILRELGPRCASLGSKAFVVTGRRSAKRIGLLDLALAQLPGAVVFDDVEENPGTDTCERAASLCRGEQCDFVVALGGGSPMDAAKAVAALARNHGPCAAYFGSEKLDQGALPIVAVPTTAGTGSEVTPYSVLVDTPARVKRTITAKALFPSLALLDPELTRTLTASVTAATGLDALSQAMEGLITKKSAPITDALAIETCRAVRRWLPAAVREPNNIDARAGMMYAALLSGCVIAHTGTTLVHGMGYYFTLEYGLPHGLANGLLLTPVFQFNARYEPEKAAGIARALGVPAEPNPDCASRGIGEAIHALFHDINVSPAARDAGVAPNRLAEFARDVFADPYRYRNQVGDIAETTILRFFQQAWDGVRQDPLTPGFGPTSRAFGMGERSVDVKNS